MEKFTISYVVSAETIVVLPPALVSESKFMISTAVLDYHKQLMRQVQ